jgi:hypothetical protein
MKDEKFGKRLHEEGAASFLLPGEPRAALKALSENFFIMTVDSTSQLM